MKIFNYDLDGQQCADVLDEHQMCIATFYADTEAAARHEAETYLRTAALEKAARAVLDEASEGGWDRYPGTDEERESLAELRAALESAPAANPESIAWRELLADALSEIESECDYNDDPGSIRGRLRAALARLPLRSGGSGGI